MPEGTLTIIGCGAGLDCLAQKAFDAALSSEVLAGGERLLRLFPDFKGERIAIGANAVSGAVKLLELAKTKRVSVLASGDPLLHGIGGTFARLNPGVAVSVIPNVSAMQSFCSKLLIPWDEVRLFSIHGSNFIQWREMLSSGFAVVYCDLSKDASRLASLLVETFPAASGRPAAIASDLGLDSESIHNGTLAGLAKMECGALSMLALLPSGNGLFDDGLSLGMPDSCFSCEGRMMTHPELRAIAISKLRLGAGVMWDVGAGSGSVGIESSLLVPGLKVFSIEKDLGRIADIKSNADKFGASSIMIVTGKAPDALRDLPRPRSVFIGGGGSGIADILTASWDALLPGGTIVAVAALLETKAALTSFKPETCCEVVSIAVSRSSQLLDSRLMKAENPSDLFVFRKPFEVSK